MKLEPPFRIDSRKLTHYLLVLLPRSDKSVYLILAGYTLENWPALEKDLLALATNEVAAFEDEDKYGPSFSIISELIGLTGVQLKLRRYGSVTLMKELLNSLRYTRRNGRNP